MMAALPFSAAVLTTAILLCMFSTWKCIYALGYVKALHESNKRIIFIEAARAFLLLMALSISIYTGLIIIGSEKKDIMHIFWIWIISLSIIVFGIESIEKKIPAILKTGGALKGFGLSRAIQVLRFYGVISEPEAEIALRTLYSEGPNYLKKSSLYKKYGKGNE